MFDVNEPTGLLVRGIIEEVDLSAKFWPGIQSQFDVWQKNQIFFPKHLGGGGGRATTKWVFWHFAIFIVLRLICSNYRLKNGNSGIQT